MAKFKGRQFLNGGTDTCTDFKIMTNVCTNLQKQQNLRWLWSAHLSQFSPQNEFDLTFGRIEQRL